MSTEIILFMWARRGKKQKRKIRIILVLAILVVKCACFHNNIERIIISVRKLGRQQKKDSAQKG